MVKITFLQNNVAVIRGGTENWGAAVEVFAAISDPPPKKISWRRHCLTELENPYQTGNGLSREGSPYQI